MALTSNQGSSGHRISQPRQWTQLRSLVIQVQRQAVKNNSSLARWYQVMLWMMAAIQWLEHLWESVCQLWSLVQRLQPHSILQLIRIHSSNQQEKKKRRTMCHSCIKALQASHQCLEQLHMEAGVSNTTGQQPNHSQWVKEVGVSHMTLCMARLLLIPKTDK